MFVFMVIGWLMCILVSCFFLKLVFMCICCSGIIDSRLVLFCMCWLICIWWWVMMLFIGVCSMVCFRFSLV